MKNLTFLSFKVFKKSINMKKNELPSNRKFGSFFTLIFILLGIFFFKNNQTEYLVFLLLAFIFFIITITKPDLLRPLNEIWMWFGLALGAISSPIVLGIIFFGIFTPLSLLMQLFGRDELQIKMINKKSYWIEHPIKDRQLDRFKQQF